MTYAENGKWDIPLYNGIDLLIVDESDKFHPNLPFPPSVWPSKRF